MMTRPLGAHRRGGFTLLETMMAVALLAMITVKIHHAMVAANQATSESTRRIVVEDQARRVLQQIAVAVMGANRSTLIPDAAAPLSMSDMRFQVNLGIQDGSVVWSDPEQVALDDGRSQVFWSSNPEAPNATRVVWSNLVTPFLEGELPNGMDDNGNGLIDEKGLSFAVDRNAVRIRLTLERVSEDGDSVIETVETTVTCRNLNVDS